MSDSKSQQQEPSMEDILSSIRRIISEDGDQKSEAEAIEANGEDVPEAEAIPELEVPGESDDVFDLTEMVDESGNVVELGEEAGEEGVPEALEVDEEEVYEGVEEDTVEAVADEDTKPLMSDGAEEQATEALSKLTKVASPDPVDPSLLRIMNSGLTIEQYVLEMLRPMLREWLDQNLPPMAERLVEREIEKLARRAYPLD